MRIICSAILLVTPILGCGDKSATPETTHRLLPEDQRRETLTKLLHREEINVCMTGEAISDSIFKKVPEILLRWIKPLETVAVDELVSKINTDIQWHGCSSATDIEIHSARDVSDDCLTKDKERSCALPWTLPPSIYFFSYDSEATLLHEFGHLFGFADMYYEEGATTLDGDQEDKETGCIKPFRDTVMCQPRDELYAPDMAAIRKQYCDYWSCN